MIRKSASLLTLVFGIVLLNGCGSLRVKAPIAYGSQPEIGKIALVATLVGPINQPETPIADASTFNKKTEALAKEINELMKNKANQYYQTLGKGLEIQLGTEVIYGEELKKAERYDRAIKDEEKEPLTIKGAAPFHHIYVGEGGFNPLQFDKGMVNQFLEESPRMRSIARGLTRDLESEAVAFSYHQMVIEGVVSFGSKAKAKLVTNIYIFNDRGELIGHGYGETEAVDIVGDTLEEYTKVMNKYPDIQNLVLTEMAKVEEEETEEE